MWSLVIMYYVFMGFHSLFNCTLTTVLCIYDTAQFKLDSCTLVLVESLEKFHVCDT